MALHVTTGPVLLASPPPNVRLLIRLSICGFADQLVVIRFEPFQNIRKIEVRGRKGTGPFIKWTCPLYRPKTIPDTFSDC